MVLARAPLYKWTGIETNPKLMCPFRFLAPLENLPLDDRAAEEYGLIRADLERTGTPIGPNDLLIAATARAHDCILVTRNTREFTRIVGLRVENWDT